MLWRRKRRFDPEIAPDEIFLDVSNAPAFDRARFEGRLEKPLSSSLFFSLGTALVLLFCILIVRTWNLQLTNGAMYAARSEQNSLAVTPLFAPRGIITDMHTVVLAENIEGADGSVRRNYPFHSFSQIIGYVSYPKKDSSGNYYDMNKTGITGLEAEYDFLLAGKNGQKLTETDAFGNIRSEGSIIPAQEGKSLQLSLDANLQQLLERAIARIANSSHFISGAGIILETHSGAVRAIVSYPSYDANVMASGGPSEVITAYKTHVGHPFLDHVLQGVYAPGSIVKPFVASGALTDGLITSDTIINDTGFLSIPDPYRPGKEFIYRGWKSLGPVDVKKAIAWSSDIFFYIVGGGFKNQKGLGIGRLDYWYRMFGLGTTTGIALAGEASGLIPTPEWKQETLNEQWYLGDTYFTAIGQYAMQVTPIQMARATAALVNGGELFTPTLLAGQTPTYVDVPVDASALEHVRAGMRESVTSALASALHLPYVTVAAKTGTAETGTRNQYENSWVIGFFPYTNPRYAFAVVLERGPSGSGSQAVNVMRDLFDALHAQNSPYVGGTGTSTSGD